jgi:PTH1 family peptidyl-tRNA hydrolase
MKVIFGLGNPDRKYQGTRHNVGAMVVEELARQHQVMLRASRFEAAIGEAFEAGESIRLVRSGVYMNCSGEPLRLVLDYYQVAPQDALCICDDYNLDLGRLRFRRRGSSGGHHGLESIAACLGTDDFPRLRLGIGRVDSAEAIGFVLGRFTDEEAAAMGPAICRAAEGAWLWAAAGIEACMNRYNRPPEEPNDAEEEPS